MGSVPSTVAERILEDSRKAVGEVRFGFGKKRQVWAFEERHTIDAAGLLDELSPAELLDLCLHFHDEFAAVSNPWRVRDRMERLLAEGFARGDAALARRGTEAVVDDNLGVRHWLLAAVVNGPAKDVFDGLEAALSRAYLPPDQWALLARLRAIAGERGWRFSPDTTRALAILAQFALKPEERQHALELLASLCGDAARACLTRAARGDADEAVRAYASGLLTR